MIEVLEQYPHQGAIENNEISHPSDTSKLKNEVINNQLDKIQVLSAQQKSSIDSIYNESSIKQKFPQFNAEKFATLSKQIDRNNTKTGIPQEYISLMKGILISESCMDYGKKMSKTSLEQMYVFDDMRKSTLSMAVPTFMKPGAELFSQWSKGIYDYYNKHRRKTSKEPWDNALGDYQIQTIMFCKIICLYPELITDTIQIIQSLYTNHPGKDKLIQTLNTKNDQKRQIIIKDPDMLSIMQQLSFNNEITQKVIYAYIKDNEKTFTSSYNSYGIQLDHGDLLLTCGLAHLKGPGKTYDAILQQNLYLLAQSLGLNIHSILGSSKAFPIDGEIQNIQDNYIPSSEVFDDSGALPSTTTAWGATKKLYEAVKNKLMVLGVGSLKTVALQDMMGSLGSASRKNMIERLQDTENQLQSRGIAYHFHPLLSVRALQPLQKNGMIHLTYIFHYLNSLQINTAPPSTTNTVQPEIPPKASNQPTTSYDPDHSIPSPGDTTLKFRIHDTQYAHFNEKGELVGGNISGLNWIKCMYSRSLAKNNTWDQNDINTNTQLQNVKNYKDIFNNTIQQGSTIIIDQTQKEDISYRSTIINRMLQNANGDKEKCILGFRRAAKITDIVYKDGKAVDILVQLPIKNTSGAYTIQTLSVFGKDGMIDRYHHVYLSIIKTS